MESLFKFMCINKHIVLFLLFVSLPEWLLFSQQVMELISTALRNPLSPVEDNTEQTVCSWLLLNVLGGC